MRLLSLSASLLFLCASNTLADCPPGAEHCIEAVVGDAALPQVVGYTGSPDTIERRGADFVSLDLSRPTPECFVDSGDES